MTDEAISPLRRRMIEDMTIRNFAAKTQKDYIRHVKKFSVFFGRSPDKATAEDIRRYQLHMKANGASVTTMAGAVNNVLPARHWGKSTLGQAADLTAGLVCCRVCA